MNHMIKLHKDIKLKSGETITKGTYLEFVSPAPEFKESVGIFNWNGRDIKMRYRSILRNPSMHRLGRWSMDGISESVFGNNVEPDGYGPLGEPSWLLALRLI